MVADIDPAVPSRLRWLGSGYPPRTDNLVVLAESGPKRLIGRPTRVGGFALRKLGQIQFELAFRNANRRCRMLLPPWSRTADQVDPRTTFLG
jgi:hypothetical protein